MSQLIIVTTPPNSGLGTPLATAFDYTNSNFTELYARVQTSPPATLYGKVGDVPGMYAYDPTYFYYCYAEYSNGSSLIWGKVTQVSNVSISQIINGTSNVSISSANANVTVGVNGVGNVVVFATTGAYVNGLLSATGNITGNNIYANSVAVVGNLAIAGDASATGTVTVGNLTTNGTASAGGTITGGNLTTGGTASATGNVTGGNLLTGGIVSSTGNVTGGNILTSGLISATGDITGGNFKTGGTISATGAVINTVSATGNIITNDYFVGDGSKLTNVTATANISEIFNGLSSVNIPVNSGDVTVTVGFSSNLAVFSTNGVDISGTVTATNTNLSGTASVTGNITGGNILTLNQISAVGNIYGNYLYGNGSYLTGIQTGTNYGNANVAAYLPTYTGNIKAGNISVTGTVTGNLTGYVTGQFNGLVNNVNPAYGAWDFGYIVANTYTNPLQWIFAQTSLGNIDMGTITAPASYAIDIGTIF
jgi:hypothetical protein